MFAEKAYTTILSPAGVIFDSTGGLPSQTIKLPAESTATPNSSVPVGNSYTTILSPAGVIFDSTSPSVMRVYEDGTIAVKNEGKFWRLNPETLKIENPIDESVTKSDNLGPWFSY